VAPLEPWEKVLVKSEDFMGTVHGQIECVECHQGDRDEVDKDVAHADLISRPSDESEQFCGECHPDVTAHYPESLHASQQGYWTTMEARGAHIDDPAIQQMFGNHCASCHTSCGDCHVSQPGSVGGGFIDGHVFNRTPSMTRNCTACHGSRVGNEYLGKHEGLMGDIHFRQGRMTCVDCHTSQILHGADSNCDECHSSPEGPQVPKAETRYGGLQIPRCETCHIRVTTGSDGIAMHEQHGSELSCQVCHSIAYTSCDGCHVSISETTGNPRFSTDGSYLTFLIGKNPFKSYDRPYDYVPVRHIPIDPESYSYYGENLLPTFGELPTWAYATPHNTQLVTPQTESCNSCHGNPALFLTLDKIDPAERGANLSVYIESIPGSVIEPDVK